MGQYHYIVNLDKREFLHSHQLDCGLKFREMLHSSPGPLQALFILIGTGQGKGGGDLNHSEDIVGRWAGDRIATVGDYAEAGDAESFNAEEVYQGMFGRKPSPLEELANAADSDQMLGWTDISDLVRPALEKEFEVSIKPM